MAQCFFCIQIPSVPKFYRLSRDNDRDGGVLGRLRGVERERERDRLGVRLEYRRRGGDLKLNKKQQKLL